jgi:hypothetical protein
VTRPWSVYVGSAISAGYALSWSASFARYETAAARARQLVKQPSREHHRVTVARVFWGGDGPDPRPEAQHEWRRASA